jgi:hypothetical protein
MLGCGFVRPRAERGVDGQRVVREELVEITPRVRYKADLEPVAAELLQHRQDVFVEVEVRRALPGARHLDRTLARLRQLSPHAQDDLLREGDPDLLVVLEIRMALNAF